jgi:SAM-dependent methyltransferase
VRNGQIAENYDQFLAGDPLTHFDWQIVSRCLPPIVGTKKPVVVEFGCGTGRTLIPLIERGYKTIGVDLSLPMLKQMGRNLSLRLGQPPDDGSMISIQANFVQLDCLAEDCCDHGVCLFSTLGMIAGNENRRQFLDHARRTIKDGGTFVLHAHNLWQQLRHPGGWRWFGKHLIDVAGGKCQLGDRFATYRSISEMFIHSFRKRELESLLNDAGFRVEVWHRVEDPQKARATVGWVVVCR